MNTIVIPYRSEVNNGIELRYALRSIEKYLSGWDNDIVIVTTEVRLFDQFRDIEIIFYEDQPGRKEFNIYSKLLAACNDSKVSDDFILWNDDHFLLQPIDVSEIKYWHNGPLVDQLQSIINGQVITASGRYRRVIERTLEIIPDYFVDNYDIHTPIIFNKKLFKETFSNRQEELCVKSFYCYENYQPEENREFMPDLKIGFQIPYDRLKEKIANRLFFSTDRAAIGPDLIRLWEELYPSPSKFELR